MYVTPLTYRLLMSGVCSDTWIARSACRDMCLSNEISVESPYVILFVFCPSNRSFWGLCAVRFADDFGGGDLVAHQLNRNV